MAKATVLTPQSTDFPRWYQEVVAKAELADNGPVRGTMVIRPYGYAIWEGMQAQLDQRIKATGTKNAYFPIFIPESYLRREAEHVEGFSPELAVVTYGGGKELDEPVVVRPTSETVINAFFAKWVQSWRDLPMLINQWANVVRWELRPRLFLRSSEFLWQEGHTVHASQRDARDFALRILSEVYRDFMVNVLAIPVLVGRKTARERFAGAIETWTCEAMMRDGKALQMGTSHELGQNFAKAFGIEFQSETGESLFGWQTSWGASTRMIGALIMAHGDDNGLRLPPRLAPIQVAVVMVKDGQGVGEAASAIATELTEAGVRSELDADTETSFGRRVTDWELKGVPVRLEIGPRDLAQEHVTLVRRDSATKTSIPLATALEQVRAALDQAQEALLTESEHLLATRTVEVQGLKEAIEAAETGFAKLPWAEIGTQGEADLAQAGLSVRCLQGRDGGLSVEDEVDAVAIVGKAY